MTLLIVIAVIILLYVFVLLRPQRREIDRFCLRPYAHRGQHDENLPENSLAAFRRAVENGYGIELDLQLSSDGEVMVMHDYNLERMTGCDKMLKELTAAELQKLHLNGTEERVPTLKEVLDIVKGKVPLLIELKGESTDVSLCPKANEILKDYGGKYIIESFNPLMLSWYRKNRPGRCARNSHYQYLPREKAHSLKLCPRRNDAQRRGKTEFYLLRPQTPRIFFDMALNKAVQRRPFRMDGQQ